MNDISKLPKPVKLSFVKVEPSTGIDSSKAPVVCFHGVFGNKEGWVDLGRSIADHTKRVVYCFDLRDHGDSPFTNEISFEAMIADMVNFMNENKIEKALMLGHSLGGLIFSRLASLYPNLCEKLILVDIHPRKKLGPSKDGKPNMVTLFIEMLIKTREKMRAEKMDLEQAKKLLSDTLKPLVKNETLQKKFPEINFLCIRDGQVDWRFNLDPLKEFLKTIFQDSDIKISFDGPTLEVYGELSDFVSKEDEESIKQMLPNIIFKSIEGADHVLPATHPKEFLKIVIEFINA